MIDVLMEKVILMFAIYSQYISYSVVEHLPLNGKYTFYSQQYSDVAVSEKHFTNSREIGVAALCVPYKEHVLTSLHTPTSYTFHDAFYEHQIFLSRFVEME